MHERTGGTGDKLAIMNGATTVATLQLSGNYASDIFTATSDGHGGTDIAVAAGGAGPAAGGGVTGADVSFSIWYPDASSSPSAAVLVSAGGAVGT